MSAVITPLRGRIRQGTYAVTLLLPAGGLHDYRLEARSLNDLADRIEAIVRDTTTDHVGVTVDRDGRVFIRLGWKPSEHAGTWAPTKVPR